VWGRRCFWIVPFPFSAVVRVERHVFRCGVAVMMKTKDNDFQGGEQIFLGWIDKAGRSASLNGTIAICKIIDSFSRKH
jgi:hypothetical protein